MDEREQLTIEAQKALDRLETQKALDPTGDVTRVRDYIECLLKERDKAEGELETERWQHAACLTIAEGAPGMPPKELRSQAIRAVKRLRNLSDYRQKQLEQIWQLTRIAFPTDFADAVRRFTNIAEIAGHEPFEREDEE